MLVDIGVNFTNSQLHKDQAKLIHEAGEANVRVIVLTGTSENVSRKSISMLDHRLQGVPASDLCHLFSTVGVHPHEATSWKGKETGTSTSSKTIGTLQALREMLKDHRAVAVGECGLDYNRNHSPPEVQRAVFRAQVDLALELKMPLFLHEREAHIDLIGILDEAFGVCTSATTKQDGKITGDRQIEVERTRLESLGGKKEPPVPVVVHCFTGSARDLRAYLARGYYIGLTGTICKHVRGAPLRELLSTHQLPLDRLMLETDAPFMGFVKSRRRSEPADVVGVANCVADCLNVPLAQVCETTTRNALRFFRLDPTRLSIDS
eukprot:gb/GEZN01009291.1/.p1 GENE.gb/GEZN01009291.1/~~gb/GEZN01009291.1/.p1  ORF type:complete len:321 (+),score=31.38 gb/GEZN01009291.1/:295-1257(+)